jgi:hypothetical protein
MLEQEAVFIPLHERTVPVDDVVGRCVMEGHKSMTLSFVECFVIAMISLENESFLRRATIRTLNYSQLAALPA